MQQNMSMARVRKREHFPITDIIMVKKKWGEVGEMGKKGALREKSPGEGKEALRGSGEKQERDGSSGKGGWGQEGKMARKRARRV